MWEESLNIAHKYLLYILKEKNENRSLFLDGNLLSFRPNTYFRKDLKKFLIRNKRYDLLCKVIGNEFYSVKTTNTNFDAADLSILFRGFKIPIKFKKTSLKKEVDLLEQESEAFLIHPEFFEDIIENMNVLITKKFLENYVK